ncbi:MAG: epoxyqueuosine reductase QueH, partial [Erysipelotrichaceae bacterium]|nr:epoxyqueuosine reductase QueH [Erysipelotrichaceae bacterium]
ATGGQSYTWSPDTGLPTTIGSSITASPTSTITYTVTGVGENGCNGTAEVTVTVNQPTTSEFAETACDSYEWNGTTYDQTGDYTQTFTNANGCEYPETTYLYADFKKGDGIIMNDRMNKELGLYHQDYCGCIYSIR